MNIMSVVLQAENFNILEMLKKNVPTNWNHPSELNGFPKNVVSYWCVKIYIF